MPISINGFSMNGFSFIPSITATAGNTTSVSAYQNRVMTSFNPFSLVEYGIGAYTYFVSSGALPTGITIDPSTGLVSGTPTVSQSAANVVFSVRDVTNEAATTTSTVSFTILDTYSISYLVVGGGGGGAASSIGGGQGGGGGAGGFLSGNTTVNIGSSYTITVGAGAPVSPFPSNAANGSNSIMSAPSVPSFTTITAIGGGHGATGQVTGGGGGTGGSGGGALYCTCTSYGRFGIASGSPGVQGVAGPQGFPGGTATLGNGGAGGGGGAGGAGLNAPSTTGANGGSAKLWPFTGNYYAGGGAGGSKCATPTFGFGGNQPPASPALKGGGGDGGYTGSSSGKNATVNTGGGGGGGLRNASGAGGSGGSGIIGIAVSTPLFPGVSLSGSYSTATPPSAPGFTVVSFTGPGTYTA